MQATVASYDEDSRSGSVVTDGGVALDFSADSLADHIRHLRPGQRVHVDTSEAGVSGVHLWR